MYADENAFYQRCIRKGIILDANVLTTYLVGSYAGAEAIDGHKRAKYNGYMHGDFDVLKWIVGLSRKIIATRYILSQVSDFYPLEGSSKGIRYCSEKAIDEMRNIIIEDCTSIDALSNRIFTKQFGYADASIIEIAKKNYAILTIDGPLMSFLANINSCTINMDRLRVMYAKEAKTLRSFI